MKYQKKREAYGANQMLTRCYVSSSNVYVFIKNIENQINNAVFKHNYCK